MNRSIAVTAFAAALSVACASADPVADSASREAPLPRVFTLDARSLAETKRLVAVGAVELTPAMERLRSEADETLDAGPFSVIQKKHSPPSGDKHDYMSVGPYWWPDPDKLDGTPYIRRDGEVNPEWHRYDSVPMAAMCRAVETLALAHYLTEREAYGNHAAHLLRVWFIAPATRMNPHLQYGQAIPGRCTGRGIGIIDTAKLVRLVDAVGMLGGCKTWTKTDQAAMEKWFGEYLDWIVQSKYGRDEARTRNNHATWYDAQVAAFALFTRRADVARRVLNESTKRRIASQIEPDGRQPHELARTKSFGYSTMNLRGMFELAALAERVDVDLWNFRTDDGRGIRAALDWLIPYAVGEKTWEHRQIKEFHPAGFVALLRRAAAAYREPAYTARIAELQGVDVATDRANLLYRVGGE